MSYVTSLPVTHSAPAPALATYTRHPEEELINVLLPKFNMYAKSI